MCKSGIAYSNIKLYHIKMYINNIEEYKVSTLFSMWQIFIGKSACGAYVGH